MFLKAVKVNICYESFINANNNFLFLGQIQLISILTTTRKYHYYLFIYILLLIIPAFFLNLGILPFIHDEAIRANVTLEMIFSGNYIVPTINGEVYLNKPPFFNWILIVFTKITGSYHEFTFRLPVVLSLLLFAFTVYYTLRKDIGKEAAFLTALALLTCGRILFYDSFRGLIEIGRAHV